MKKLGFFGGGKMAEGILSALLSGDAGFAPGDVIVAERDAARAAYLAGRYAVETTGDVRDVARGCRLVILAVRPQDVAQVAADAAGLLGAGSTLVSIVAGKRLDTLKELFPGVGKLARVMPNLAVRAGAGMCVACGDDADAVAKLLSATGAAIVLDEKHFDAVTALSGSGPAYFAYMLEAMAEGGEAIGLDKEAARLLALQTMFGTAKYLRESGAELGAFIAGVCTKGGTTAAGMEKLDASDFKAVVASTLAAAAERSRQLGG